MNKIVYALLKSGVLIILLFLTGCSKKDDANLTIDGYHSSSEVAASSLVAYWSFNNGNQEFFSSGLSTISIGGVPGPAKGQIGDALQFPNAAMVFANVNFNNTKSLTDFTISLWVNVQNTKSIGGTFTPFLALIPQGTSDIWGNIVLGADTGNHRSTSDTLELRSVFTTQGIGGATTRKENTAKPNVGQGSWFIGANQWSHFVARWNSSTHQFQIFGNGVSVGAHDDQPTNTDNITLPLNVVIGSLAASDLGFTNAPTRSSSMPLPTFALDDLRIFNAAISDTEILALFHLGKARK